jgi:hypothetical protein
MQNPPMITPLMEDLLHLPVEIRQGDERWVRSVVAETTEGDQLVITWDEVAQSTSIRWRMGGREVLVMEREYVVEVAVSQKDGDLVMLVRTRSEGLEGTLRVQVGSSVHVVDALLAR